MQGENEGLEERSRLLRVQINGFGAFAESGSFELEEGLSAFIGINNSGKTALLWALTLLDRASHRTRPWHNVQQSMIEGYSRKDQAFELITEFDLPENLRDSVLQKLLSATYKSRIPMFSETKETFEIHWGWNGHQCGFREGAVYCNFLTPGGKRRKQQFFHPIAGNYNHYVISHPFDAPAPDTFQPQQTQVDPRGLDTSGARIFSFNPNDNVLRKVWESVLSDVFLITARRSQDFSEEIGMTTELSPDARNLVQVLGTAQWTTKELPDGRERFLRIEDHLRTVFPEIRRLRTQVKEYDNNNDKRGIELVLDLKDGNSVPLSHSGSGVQQVLAILTASILATERSLILIDEPHSFLHPAAERSIVRILEREGKVSHHYICVTTHSSILASHARSNLFAVRFNATGGSKVADLKDARQILGVLGVNNADLFTYDQLVESKVSRIAM